MHIMLTRFLVRSLAILGLFAAALTFVPHQAEARHWHGGGFRGGYGGFGGYRGGFYGGFGRGYYGGFGRGFYGGYYPRYYAGYYRPYYGRYYGGYYPGGYGGYGYGYGYPAYYGGGYSYPVYNNYGCGCAVNTVQSYPGLVSVPVNPAPVVITTTKVSPTKALPKLASRVVTPAQSQQFQTTLVSNPYRASGLTTPPASLVAQQWSRPPVQTDRHINPYGNLASTKEVAAPPVPGLE